MTVITTVIPHDRDLHRKMENKPSAHATHSAIYGLGLIGAAVYYISQAATFWSGLIGFLKALVWPAFLVYEALKSLHA